MSICQKCQKPVYFAERKTSLGKDWHPNCLCCEECGKILQPGRHAEHKGKPYCQNPCYMALFGPRIMGYGQNVFSPANFIRNGERNGERNGHYHTIATTPQRPEKRIKLNKREKELQERVDLFNLFYEKKRGSLLTAEKTDGSFVITGPLRIYWGVIKPIYLKQFDTTPKPRHSKSLRHSFYSATREDIQAELQNTQRFLGPKSPTSPKITRGLDDSFLQSSPSNDVVFRRPNIKKFNTVAVRGERPNKWKRASINDHIYFAETRVFTPVIGSCTSVTVDNQLKTSEVIKTLLEKFKVENQADEYQLYIVPEAGGERLLKHDDIPLVERLMLGPEESVAKIFIKDRLPPDEPFEAFTTIKEGSVLISQPDEITEVQDITLPEEVEMLVALPEPVLRGVMKKFDNDYCIELKKLKEKYDKVRSRLLKRIEELKTKL